MSKGLHQPDFPLIHSQFSRLPHPHTHTLPAPPILPSPHPTQQPSIMFLLISTTTEQMPRCQRPTLSRIICLNTKGSSSHFLDTATAFSSALQDRRARKRTTAWMQLHRREGMNVREAWSY